MAIHTGDDATPIRLKATEWGLQTSTGNHLFSSLSQMAQWLNSNPVPDHELVILARNNRVIYCGLWGGGLSDAPTLL